MNINTIKYYDNEKVDKQLFEEMLLSKNVIDVDFKGKHESKYFDDNVWILKLSDYSEVKIRTV